MSKLRPGYEIGPKALEALGLGKPDFLVRNIRLDIEPNSVPRAVVEGYANPEQVAAFAALLVQYGITTVQLEASSKPLSLTDIGELLVNLCKRENTYLVLSVGPECVLNVTRTTQAKVEKETSRATASQSSTPTPAPKPTPIATSASKQITNGLPLIVEGLKYYTPSKVTHFQSGPLHWVYDIYGPDGRMQSMTVVPEAVDMLGLVADYDTLRDLVRHRVALTVETNCRERFGPGFLIKLMGTPEYRWALVKPDNAPKGCQVGFSPIPAPTPAATPVSAPVPTPAPTPAPTTKQPSAMEAAIQYIIDCLDVQAQAQAQKVK